MLVFSFYELNIFLTVLQVMFVCCKLQLISGRKSLRSSKIQSCSLSVSSCSRKHFRRVRKLDLGESQTCYCFLFFFLFSETIKHGQRAKQTSGRTRRGSDTTVRRRTAASSADGSSSPGLPGRWSLRCWSAGRGLLSHCRLLQTPTGGAQTLLMSVS